MGGGVERAAHGVSGLGDDPLVGAGDDRADGHLACIRRFARQIERPAHRLRQRKDHGLRLTEQAANVSLDRPGSYCALVAGAA